MNHHNQDFILPDSDGSVRGSYDNGDGWGYGDEGLFDESSSDITNADENMDTAMVMDGVTGLGAGTVIH